MARAARSVRSAARRIVPLPQNGSRMRSPRREQSRIASAIRPTGFGVGPHTILSATHTDTVAKNPDLVKRFVRATIASYKATEADPQAATEKQFADVFYALATTRYAELFPLKVTA